MANLALRWKAATGFLAMIFLLPGMYALECYTSTSFHQFDSKGRLGFDRATLVHNSTCSSGNDVCISVQFELSTDANTVLVNHRGCFAKDPRDVEEATTLGHRYLAIRSNLSYCHSDFCNIRSDFAEDPQTTEEDPTEASHPNGAIQCYSGQNHNSSEVILAKITCSNSSDLCYQGRYSITVGNMMQVFYIRSCQSSSCDVPQHQTFGPIKLTFLEGSCCPGSDCNEKEDTSQIPDDTISGPTGASYGESAGNHTTYFVDSDVRNGSQKDPEYDVYNDDTGDEELFDPSLHPRGRGPSSKGSSLQFCPLLLATGMTVCKLGW